MIEKKQEPEVEEFMEIGGSPVPGITLRQVLRGHTNVINRIAWSPDGRYLASPSTDKTVCIWDIGSGKCISILGNQTNPITTVAWSPHGEWLALGHSQGTIEIWDFESRHQIITLEEHRSSIVDIAWSFHKPILVSASSDKTIRLWDINTWQITNVLIGHRDVIDSMAISPDGTLIASSGVNADKSLRFWDIQSGKNERELDYSDHVVGLAWSPDSSKIAVGIGGGIIEIRDVQTEHLLNVLEGHTDIIVRVHFSFDGQLLASKSLDHTVRLWRTDSWAFAGEIQEQTTRSGLQGLAFNPRLPILASLGEMSTAIRIWDINYPALYQQSIDKSVRYTTAKLVLVGDSGVGKTGLGWRLAYNEFKEHSSTHGQQFWVIPQLGKKRQDGTECEAVLWDLAGQPDYRLIHSLYLDDVDTAMVLFDPTNRQEPLSGVDFWLNQLKRKDKNLCNTILVGARTDRGTSTLTDDEIQAYCERNGICGGYIPTSAKDGAGLEQLLEILKAQIPWDEMTATVTTVTFKRIKEFVLALKEKTERKGVLVSPQELRKQLESVGTSLVDVPADQGDHKGRPNERSDEEWTFTDAEMMTAVGHLETHGYVKILHGSNGQHTILLAPDVLVNLASSIVLEARRNPRGLGVLEEARLLRGEYAFPELKNLSADEQKILLDAATVLFLEHHLCFRETFNEQTFLVFPSLINEKRPLDESIQTEEGASYRVKGAVENVYASLVVLLGYTNTFIRTHQWQNQAQYEMDAGQICGFQQIYSDGGIELVLYYGIETPEPVRLMFRGLFERFLSRRELEISRYQGVKCAKCDAPLARNVVMDQLNKSKNFSFCHECGEKVSLPSPEPLTRLSRKEEVILDAQQAVAQRRTAFEAALVRVKGLLRDRGEAAKPTCFISYAWGKPEHQRWVLQLAKDLRNSGIDVLLDQWHVIPGANLDRYIEQIMQTDFVVVVGTSGLLQKYNSTTSDPVVTAELEMLNMRLRQPNKYGHTILPILVEGEADKAFPLQMQKLIYMDFKLSTYYFRQLFDMIWRLFDLPFDNPLLEELRTSMTPPNDR